ncbi:MAG TPA: hypothetical protein VFZ40_02205 [Pyrinomonadaceae bacterium]
MKRSSQVVAILGVMVFSVFFAANVSAQTGPVAGVYENFTVGKESGDLVGMRVMIIPAHDTYYAMVQIAQGGAEDPKPEFVDATVKGNTVEFTVGDQKYTGIVSVAGFRVKDPDGKTHVLKRRPCATLFK